MKLGRQIEQRILAASEADAIAGVDLIQSLWSDYGELVRIRLGGAAADSVILKHIKVPAELNHPRGFNTSLSHQRKLRSYQVEMAWYETFNAENLQTEGSRTAACLDCFRADSELFVLLEDLDQAGFDQRLESVSWDQAESVIRWLAHFHGKFLQRDPVGLWPTGTYWHLATRPDELAHLSDDRLRNCAAAIDARLNQCPWQTIVHGDAKLANFCFAQDSNQVAAVDFQYVGQGPGMKDLAYFVGSCFAEEECEQLEDRILDSYFSTLQTCLNPSFSCAELESSWRPLYRVAWADFHRFLKGWSPDHWKINSYSERVTQEVVDELTPT